VLLIGPTYGESSHCSSGLNHDDSSLLSSVLSLPALFEFSVPELFVDGYYEPFEDPFPLELSGYGVGVILG
jgi:hypothetical protein